MIRAHSFVVRNLNTFFINSKDKRNFDPRPEIYRNVTQSQKESFLSNLLNILPDSVPNISHAPPPTHDVPPSLIDIAENIIETLTGADKEELIKAFAAQLSFNDFQLAELEKVTRNQASSHYWWEQRKGRITASRFHDVYTKVQVLFRNREKPVKCKISPLILSLVDPIPLDNIPSLQWGKNMNLLLLNLL